MLETSVTVRPSGRRETPAGPGSGTTWLYFAAASECRATSLQRISGLYFFFLWGYALPISNAVHVYFSGFPLFSAGDLNKRSIFFMRDYLKFFFFFSYGGGVKTTTSTASPWMRISAACDVCTMYIVLFIETECENIFSLVWGGKKNPMLMIVLQMNRNCLTSLS